MEGYDQFSIGFLPSSKKENTNFAIVHSVLQKHHILNTFMIIIISSAKMIQRAYVTNLTILEFQGVTRYINIEKGV